MDIQLIKDLVCSENVILTEHFLKRMRERNIKIANVEEALLNGEIIENYPSDYPYPSCLVLGFYSAAVALHVVVGVCLDDDKLWLITVYQPNINKWSDDFKTRKSEDKT